MYILAVFQADLCFSLQETLFAMLVETTGELCLHGEYPVLQIRIPEPVPF
jgi:hypothetical protein